MTPSPANRIFAYAYVKPRRFASTLTATTQAAAGFRSKHLSPLKSGYISNSLANRAINCDYPLCARAKLPWMWRAN